MFRVATFIRWPFVLAAALLWLWQRWFAARRHASPRVAARRHASGPLVQFLARKGLEARPREWTGREYRDRYVRIMKAGASEKLTFELRVTSDLAPPLQVELTAGAHDHRFRAGERLNQ